MDERVNECLEQIKGFASDVAERFRETPILTTLVLASAVMAMVLTVLMLLE
jgi:hypothetical protein